MKLQSSDSVCEETVLIMPVTPFENSKYWRSTPSPMYSSPTPSLTRSIGSDNLAALASTLDYEQRMPVGAWPSQGQSGYLHGPVERAAD